MALDPGGNDSFLFYDEACNVHDIWDMINRMRLDTQLCDCTLVLDSDNSKRFPVHKAILAAYSGYFRKLFTENTSEDAGGIIKLSSVSHEILSLVIDYVYMRKISLTMSNVFAVMALAEEWAMAGLLSVSSHFLTSELSPSNCLGIMKVAERYRCSELVSAAKTYVLNHFSCVAKESSEFLETNVETLIEIIADDRLNIQEEEEVFESVIRWVDHAAGERVQAIPGLLLHVRLGSVSCNYFLDKISGHKYVQHEDACAEIIQRAWDMISSLQRVGKDTSLTAFSPLVRPRVPREVIFVIGGWSGGTPISFFETYDKQTERWFTQATLEDTTPRAYHGMVQCEGGIYLVGGFDGQKYYSSVRRYDVVGMTWREVAPMHAHRCYVSVVQSGGRIYACGGYDGRWRLNVAEAYDPQTNQWSMLPPMNTKRSDAGADALNGKVYVVGGFDGEHCLNTVDVFDTRVSQWSLLERRLSARRSGVSAIALGGYIYALGGFNGERRLASGERYCMESGCWTPMADMAAARSNFAVANLDNKIYCIGGFNGSHTIAQVEAYDPQLDSWSDVTQMNINRSALKAAVLSDLPNAPDYTFYGYVSKTTQHDVSGDYASEQGRDVDKAERGQEEEVTAALVVS